MIYINLYNLKSIFTHTRARATHT